MTRLIRLYCGYLLFDLDGVLVDSLPPIEGNWRTGAAERGAHDVAGLRPFPGAAALLGALPPQRWGVVTSAARAVARGRLSALSLPVPDCLVAAEDVSAGKPDPEGYLKAAHTLGADAAGCAAFEGTRAGMDAALAAGMICIGIGEEAMATPDGVLAAAAANLTSLEVATSPSGFQVTIMF